MKGEKSMKFEAPDFELLLDEDEINTLTTSQNPLGDGNDNENELDWESL